MGKGLTFAVIYAIVLLTLFVTFCVLITTVNPTGTFVDHGKPNATKNSTQQTTTTPSSATEKAPETQPKYLLKVAFEDEHANVPIEEPTKEATDQTPEQYTEASRQIDILKTLRRSQRDKDEQDGSEFVILKIVDADGKTKLEVQITPHCHRRKYTRLLDISLIGNDSNVIKNDLFSKSTVVKILPNESMHLYEEEGFVKRADLSQSRDFINTTVKDEFAMKPPFNRKPMTSNYTQSSKSIDNITFSNTDIPFMRKNFSNPSKNDLSVLKAMIVKKLNEKIYENAKRVELASKRRKKQKKTLEVDKFSKLFGDNDTSIYKVLNDSIDGSHDNKTTLLEPFDFMNNTKRSYNNIVITSLVEPLPYFNSSIFQNSKKQLHLKPKSVKNVEPKNFINHSTRIKKISNSQNSTDFMNASHYKNSTRLVKPRSSQNKSTLVKNIVYNSAMKEDNNGTSNNLSVFDKDVVIDENYSTIDTMAHES